MKLNLTPEECDACTRAVSRYEALSRGYGHTEHAEKSAKVKTALENGDDDPPTEAVAILRTAVEDGLYYMIGGNQFGINGGYAPLRSVAFKLYNLDEAEWRKYIPGGIHPPSGVLLRTWLLPEAEIVKKWKAQAI